MRPDRPASTGLKRTLIGGGIALSILIALVVFGSMLPPAGDTSVGAPTATPRASLTTPTDVPSIAGDALVAWAGAMSQELRICGLAAHQLLWTHLDVSLVAVFPMADTPSHGCDFAAANIGYDNPPSDLPYAPMSAARDNLASWARMLADAYRHTDNPLSSALDQAEQIKREGLQVIVDEGVRLHRPVEPDTLLSKGATWND